ncbi:MAG: hypothetical protein A2992_07470 [Elusimicrobia bacterium RIFCSPLOWO2_01_FULL_59_12]|nr:MAG: hypothetical protein A2992_07470 [Elusimicrobia bacterium RIFCSPLOWO2_01_FULL_59_12]
MIPLPGPKLPPAKRRILIIDDNSGVRATLERYIKLIGHDVVLTKSGEEGLRLLEGSAPDLILLDISMPESDGLAILRTLHDKYADLRVIMLADTADIPKAHIALNCGAGDYITKPVDLPAIKRLLQIHLPNR